jgi:uncharacterized membrane protein
MPKDRIITFSDAVMAIVMTLLALDLRAPELPSHTTWRAYHHAVAPIAPVFVSFTLSFAIVAVYWVGHYYFFRHIKHATGTMLWLNINLLFWIALMPFPTQLLGAHPTGEIPIILYGLNQLFASIAMMLMRFHAVRAHLFTEDWVARYHGPSQSVPGLVLNSAAIIFAFVNVYVSLVCLVLIPALYFVPQAWRWVAKLLKKLNTH